MDPTLANQALHLAMEWGADFLKPTQPRMKTRYPHLDDVQLDAYDTLAREVMRFSNAYIYDQPNCDRDGFTRVLLAKYAWVLPDNITRLHSQGQYYAMK